MPNGILNGLFTRALIGAYLIFVIFSPHMQFFVNFFLHTKARKSRQNRFATKVLKLRQKPILQQKTWILHMWRHSPHHTHARCGEISDFSTSVMRRNLKLLHMWRKFRFLHFCHVEKCEITPHVEKFQNSPHLSCIEIWNFSTWQIFSPRIYPWDPWQIWGME